MTDEALTDEQWLFAAHVPGVFVDACPGAGKTRTVVARVCRLAETLAPRKGVAVLSFTNTAVEEFIGRCHVNGIDVALRHPGFVGTFDAFLRQLFIAPSGIAGVAERPAIVDSWETLGVEVRLRGRNAFAGPVRIGHIGQALLFDQMPLSRQQPQDARDDLVEQRL